MLGHLSEKQMEQLLRNQTVGRIGCSTQGTIQIFPVNYGYDGKYVYVHSKEGLKVQIMRENKNVCFEVDKLQRSGNWKSVLLWGEYEELKTTREQYKAMEIFIGQMTRLIPNSNAMPSHGIPKGPGKDNDPFKEIVFRINIKKRSGRFEIKNIKEK